MRYFIGVDRRPVDLEKEDVLNSGGEAIIFRASGRAVKIYHTPDRQRSEKLRFFFKENPRLHPMVIGPEKPVFGSRTGNKIVGFQMQLLPSRANPLAMLMRRDFCLKHAIAGKMKVQIFINMLEGLLEAHQAGLVVGDLNDQNEHFDLKALSTYWIDVDSWQLGNFPCMVGTEDYLTPDLYNTDLSKRPRFKPEHDYYSFAVLLFRSLMMVHPFGGGFHRQHKSLFDRAQNGLTIFDTNVRYPKKANPIEVMTDELADLMLKYLKRQCRDPFPLERLQEYADILVECSSCHLWYPATQSNCPGCTMKTVLTAQIAAKVVGCSCDVIFETSGNILHFQLIADSIYCIADENGTAVLYQKSKNGSLIRKELFESTPGARYAILGNTLVVCPDPVADEPKLYLVDIKRKQPRAIASSSTCKFSGGTAVFGSSGHRLYRIVGNRIMSGDLFGDHLADREVIQAISNQTWFTVASNPDLDKEVLLGCHRIFDELKWFLVIGSCDGKDYNRFDLNLDPLSRQESLIDLSVRFGAKSLLVLRHTRVRGVNYVRIEKVNISNAKVLQSHRIKISENRLYESVHGKGYTDDALLHPSDDGIVLETLSDQTTTVLKGTDNYVSGNDKLYRYKKGVLVITNDRILFLTPKS